MAHYAKAFYVHTGQCFRFVHNGVGHASTVLSRWSAVASSPIEPANGGR